MEGYTDCGKQMKLQAEVAEVKRALVSVKRICEKGNRVVFGEKSSYIENIDSGETDVYGPVRKRIQSASMGEHESRKETEH